VISRANTQLETLASAQNQFAAATDTRNRIRESQPAIAAALERLTDVLHSETWDSRACHHPGEQRGSVASRPVRNEPRVDRE